MDFLPILAASFGGGIAYISMEKWRSYKAKRRSMTAAERNSGFWTDGRVLAAEIVAFGLLFGFPLYGMALMLAPAWLGIQLPIP